MSTVRDIDRLVVRDDAVAARLWPRLGPRVRDAYVHDRDAWVVLRRTVESGGSLPAETLVAQQKVFSGWARAFRAAAAARIKHSRKASAIRRTAAPVSAAATATASPPAATVRSPATAAPPLIASAAATATMVKGSAGTAVAGGLVLAGLIALAARRKRA